MDPMCFSHLGVCLVQANHCGSVVARSTLRNECGVLEMNVARSITFDERELLGKVSAETFCLTSEAVELVGGGCWVAHNHLP